MKTKVFVIFISLMLILNISACGKKSENTDATSTITPEVTPTQTEKPPVEVNALSYINDTTILDKIKSINGLARKFRIETEVFRDVIRFDTGDYGLATDYNIYCTLLNPEEYEYGQDYALAIRISCMGLDNRPCELLVSVQSYTEQLLNESITFIDELFIRLFGNETGNNLKEIPYNLDVANVNLNGSTLYVSKTIDNVLGNYEIYESYTEEILDTPIEPEEPTEEPDEPTEEPEEPTEEPEEPTEESEEPTESDAQVDENVDNVFYIITYSLVADDASEENLIIELSKFNISANGNRSAFNSNIYMPGLGIKSGVEKAARIVGERFKGQLIYFKDYKITTDKKIDATESYIEVYSNYDEYAYITTSNTVITEGNNIQSQFRYNIISYNIQDKLDLFYFIEDITRNLTGIEIELQDYYDETYFTVSEKGIEIGCNILSNDDNTFYADFYIQNGENPNEE